MGSLSLYLLRSRPRIGDVAGNTTRVLESYGRADAESLLVTGELYISGYPPQGVVRRENFLQNLRTQLARLVEATAEGGGGILVGTPWLDSWGLDSWSNDKGADGRADSTKPLSAEPIYNALVLAEKGKIAGVVKKSTLTHSYTYDETYEFTAASLDSQAPVEWRGHKLALLISKDAHNPKLMKALTKAGATNYLIVDASPWDQEQHAKRYAVLKARSKESGLAGVYLNLIGTQEDLVFDGEALAVSANGAPLLQLQPFDETDCAFHLTEDNTAESTRDKNPPLAPPLSLQASRYTAIVSAIRDYLQPSGFSKALVGLSGGIDSALTLSLAVDALGAEQVTGVLLPSAFTSPESRADALAVAQRAGAKTHEISIEDMRIAVLDSLADILPAAHSAHPTFRGSERLLPDLAGENVQPRLRGLILMALSNRIGDALLLATGNKSEFSVGYATLYGDMCGGYAPLKDLYKTQVYELARWRNSHLPTGARGANEEIFPESLFSKPPTAELRLEQTDEDSLPPYDTLDRILHCFLEEGREPEDVVAEGYAVETVIFVWRALLGSTHKHRQSPPGPRLSSASLGREWQWHLQGHLALGGALGGQTRGAGVRVGAVDTKIRLAG